MEFYVTHLRIQQVLLIENVLLLFCHCKRIHSSLTAVHSFDNGFEGKQQVVWKKIFCVKHWSKEIKTCMDWFTVCSGITGKMLKNFENCVKHYPINQSL